MTYANNIYDSKYIYLCNVEHIKIDWCADKKFTIQQKKANFKNNKERTSKNFKKFKKNFDFEELLKPKISIINIDHKTWLFKERLIFKNN